MLKTLLLYFFVCVYGKYNENFMIYVYLLFITLLLYFCVCVYKKYNEYFMIYV